MGVKDADVYSYKQKLVTLGYDIGETSPTPSDIFTFDLKETIKKFQRVTGIININGALNEGTKNMIDDAYSKKGQGYLSLGVVDKYPETAVGDLQEKLKAIGHFDAPLNGQFDAATKAAVIDFQKKHMDSTKYVSQLEYNFNIRCDNEFDCYGSIKTVM